MASTRNDWLQLVWAIEELGQAFGFEVVFALNPVMDVMCCKVAGITVEISRTELEERRFFKLYDAMKLAMLKVGIEDPEQFLLTPAPERLLGMTKPERLLPDPCPLELEPPQPVALVVAMAVPDLILDDEQDDEQQDDDDGSQANAAA